MMKRLVAVIVLGALFLGLNPRLSQAISFADYVYQNVKTGHISAVRQYMRQGYSIDAVNSNGMSALCTAAYNKDFVTYNRLLRLGASENVDCLQKVDVAEMKTTEKQYVRSVQQQRTAYTRTTTATPVTKSAKVSGSSNTGAYIGLGALAVGGAAAAVALASSGGGGGHHGSSPEKTCPTGQHLVDGQCVPIDCPEGTVLIGNECVVPYQCMDGEYWNGSECVAMECPAGTHLVGSECVENDTCPSGQHMVDGQCVDVVCEEGYQQVGDGCVRIGECPIGQYKAGDVCVDIICPEHTHLVGNSCVADDIHIVKEDDTTLIGIGSNAQNVFNLRSVPVYPDSISTIDLDNTGNGDVYGIYGYSGEVFNSFVAAHDEEGNINKKPVGIGTIKIKDSGSGTVYGIYSHIADILEYKEAVNAYGLYNGTAYGNIEIEHTGGGVTYGLLGDVRAYNAYAQVGGNAYGDITIRGDGDMYGIYGYVATTNGLIFWFGNRAEANINMISEGDGNIYGMAISKDDIPGAGSGGHGTASWFAFNAYADSGSVDAKIDIYKKNGTGNIYGMYGGRELYNAMSYGTIDDTGKPTARSRGVINVFNAGHDNQAYGMYLPDEDEGAIIANVDKNNSESIVDIVNYSNGVATGLRGGKKVSIINSGTININNMRDGTAVGIYGESGSNIENSGLIKINRQDDFYIIDGEKINYYVDSAVGGSAYGIYAESGATVKNSGFIVISGAENGAGIYLEKGATLENTGTVQFDGTYGSIVENGDVIDIYNQGRINSSSSVELSSMGGGEVILGQGGKFFAESLSGDMSVSEKTVLGSFDDQYVIPQALQVADTSGLNTVSKSAMFEAGKVSNSSGGYDVVMNRKAFNTLIDDKSVAEFLEYNYANGNNLELYDNLKLAATPAALSGLTSSLTGKDVLPGFRRESSLVYNHLSRQFNESLFNKPDEHYLGGYKYIDVSRDKDGALGGNDGTAHSAYGMAKGKAENGITYGLGATITHLDSDYDNHSNRKSNIFGLWAPVGYEFNKDTKWFSKLYAGYEDGTYDRVTPFGKFSSDMKSYQYGLTNEIRHNIGLGAGIKLTPAAELNLLGIYQKGFDEGHKANAIRTDDENMLSLEGGLGAYLSKDFSFDKDNSLSIQIGGIYYVEFLDPDKDVDAKMQGMDKKYKLSHKGNDDHAVFSARAGYNYKNMTLYGQIEQETGSAKALTIDAGLQYNL